MPTLATSEVTVRRRSAVAVPRVAAARTRTVPNVRLSQLVTRTGYDSRISHCRSWARVCRGGISAGGVDHRRVRLRRSAEIRNTDVVKNLAGTTTRDAAMVAGGADRRTRDRITQRLLAHGAATAAQLSEELGLSPAGIRRHLDAMLDDGDVTSREQAIRAGRGRGRPARVFTLTDAARVRCGTHTYDDL